MVRRQDSLADADILSNDVWASGVPHEAFDRYRRDAPVAWINEPPVAGQAGSGFWSLTRWDDIIAVHRDWRTFSSEIGGTEIEDMADDARIARQTMLETDPPRHTALRRLISAPFARRAIADLDGVAATMVDEVLDEVLDRSTYRDGVFDAVYALARELPIRLLVKLLGVPDDDAPRLFTWADRIIYNADPDYSAAVVDQVNTDAYRLLPFRSPVTLEVFDYLRPLLDARRATPADDVLTIIANAAVDDSPLAERQQHTWILLLLIAGNETTRHALVSSLLALARHPEQFERLRNDPTVIDTAVDECLRWTSPQLHFRRTATVDTEIGGVAISAGDKVVTWYVAANYDPTQFPAPHTFDLGRTPNQHLAFGAGPHLCIGQWLARLEVRSMLTHLARRVQRIELIDNPVRVRSNFINGHKLAPMRFIPAG